MTDGSEPSHPKLDAKGEGERATVLEPLNNGLFRLQMADGRLVVAHVSKDLRMAFSRLLAGDPVLVNVSPFDPNRARICKLLDR
ncbi:MAG: translation initiation factor IF-1 [Planctomycetota bacterium]